MRAMKRRNRRCSTQAPTRMRMICKPGTRMPNHSWAHSGSHSFIGSSPVPPEGPRGATGRGLAGLQAVLLRQPLLEFILSRRLVQLGIGQLRLDRRQLLLHLTELALQLLGLALVWRQLLAQGGGGLALGTLVGALGGRLGTDRMLTG